MMLYCFVGETLNDFSNDDLCIQANYAIEKGCFVELDLCKQLFFDAKKSNINIRGKLIFLRTDYEHILDAMACIEKHEGVLLENAHHRQAIRDWPNFYSTIRKQFCVDGIKIIQQDYPEEVRNLIKTSDQVFIKSMDKGFSTLVNSIDLISGVKSNILDEVNNRELMSSQKYLISEKVEFEKDNLGNIEVRFVVLNKTLANWSRYIHSLRHRVDPFFVDSAQRIVSIMSTMVDFPENYVLDLGRITSDENSYIDVVEFNPISTAICYVNNSIFSTFPAFTEKYADSVGFGVEYLFDKLAHPQKYFLYDNGVMDFTYRRP